MNESTALTHINMGVAQMPSSLFFSDFLWQIDFLLLYALRECLHNTGIILTQ